MGMANLADQLLQWGPPGMGGVSRTYCRVVRLWQCHFNGDLPEWEV